MLTLQSHSVAETKAIAAALAGLVSVSDVVLLHGEMGAGKTVFAQGFAAGLGIHEPVTSPTFNLVHTYDSGRIVLHHADLYRLDRTAEVSDLALGELVEGAGVLLVEWGEAASGTVGDHLDLRIESTESSDDDRKLSLTPCGDSWARRWKRVEAALRTWAVAGGTC